VVQTVNFLKTAMLLAALTALFMAPGFMFGGATEKRISHLQAMAGTAGPVPSRRSGLDPHHRG
jgi:hypothetical protein